MTAIPLVGGGIGISMFGAVLISANAPELAVTIRGLGVALAISAVIGVFFGIYPANRAAALNPIDALRYE